MSDATAGLRIQKSDIYQHEYTIQDKEIDVGFRDMNQTLEELLIAVDNMLQALATLVDLGFLSLYFLGR